MGDDDPFQGKAQQDVDQYQGTENASSQDGKLSQRMGRGNIDVLAEELGCVLQSVFFSLIAVP